MRVCTQWAGGHDSASGGAPGLAALLSGSANARRPCASTLEELQDEEGGSSDNGGWPALHMPWQGAAAAAGVREEAARGAGYQAGGSGQDGGLDLEGAWVGEGAAVGAGAGGKETKGARAAAGAVGLRGTGGDGGGGWANEGLAVRPHPAAAGLGGASGGPALAGALRPLHGEAGAAAAPGQRLEALQCSRTAAQVCGQ